MKYVLRTHSVTKKYGKQTVLDRVNMNVERGDIYGFVGENGSGKTTIIRLITGLIRANNGTVELFGISDNTPDIMRARARIGAIVETPSIYLNMSAKANLNMQSCILGIEPDAKEEKVRKILDTVGLGDLYSSKKPAGNFSLGMRQRLGIAMALMGEPEFIILDEPMNGLDPAGIVEIRELILKLNREQGITFLISSHILTELALVATKYGIISKGRLVKEISAENLKNECKSTVHIATKAKRESLIGILSSEVEKKNLAPTGDGVKIYGDVNLTRILKRVLDAGIEIESVNCSSSSIEEYYLSLIGGSKNA